MYVIMFKQHGDLNCEQAVYGPFADYMDAEDALGDGRVPLLYGQGGREWPDDMAPDERSADMNTYPGWRYTMEVSPCEK